MSILDKAAIKETIPHREPFLFVDKVIEMTDEMILAELDVREDMPFFQGHYPGNPIMPGVLLCEATFQAGAILLGKTLAGKPGTPVLSRIKDAKFKRMVKPGDTIQIKTEKKETVGGFHFMRGTISKDGKLCMALECALAIVEE